MVLETYQAMRDFEATPEPKGRKRRSKGDPVFVIQKHAATRLHYDLRLEMDGVLKSWAVTRGPSLVPGEKRLSVHVEDHPMDYGDFEGAIPEGHYGAGAVILWDRGTWAPVFDAAKGYAKGHLEFELNGEKLTGRWHLIRMRGKPREKRENWLLIKGEDASARDEGAPDILEERPESVKTGRTIEEVGGKPVRKSRGRKVKPITDPPEEPSVRQAGMPGFVPPMLATLVQSTPGDDRWLHEIKFDGYRIQAQVAGGKVRLFTRSGRDWTDRFGEGIADALAALPVRQAVLDGEVVVEASGRSSDFSALQADLAEGRTDRMVYYAFDLLHLDGRDLTGLPLVDRKRLMEGLLAPASGAVRISEHLSDKGEVVLRHACRLGLEGIISKLRDGPYRSGRGKSWVKSKCSARQEFVVAGFLPSTVSARAIGSLVLGVYDGDKLKSVGRVGSGFSATMAEQLFTKLEALETDAQPFQPPLPRAEARGVRFVRPELVAEIDFRAWTGDGNLRHASFKGLREDKDPREVSGEGLPAKAAEGAAEPPPVRRIKLTHPERIYWPDEGVTKAGLADYYTEIWPWIAPHIVGRPLALLRLPDGVGGRQEFFQKHEWKGMNAAILRVQDPAEPTDAPSLAIADLDGLIALAQSAALEIHPWGSTLKDWERPDRIVIDLDPGDGVEWSDLVWAALEVKERLEGKGLAAFAKTSGGKGLHVVAPLKPKAEWPVVKTFCRDLAREMASDDPSRFVSTITKSKRQGKILVDYLRNQRGATAVAAFSTRARPGAHVSAPVTWDELSAGVSPSDFTVLTMPTRLANLRSDPWEAFARTARTLKS